ncbi:DUF3501 family protein [Actinospongicola halichondriae]|uniref:DUF3501 family protein n=1 Tax=Actinospongicola halichondriae TaxID=3236844 RepID=UPI003D5531DD
MSRKLTLDDIADLRAYEREREDFRAQVIQLKARRRVGIGPFVTVVFENRDTIRFQIQEMARVERLLTDEAIETELRTYNPLVPEPGQLAMTLFIELTSEADLRTWLPKLVGIERSLVLRIGEGDTAEVVAATPEDAHAANLTRDEITASVHYLHFHLTPEQIEAVAAGPVALGVEHENYAHETALGDETVAELLADLRP